jgi:hypothetical protein
VHRCPPAAIDPIGYLKCLGTVVSERQIDAVLPTHEQAWLLAAARPLLPAALPVAVSDLAAFDRVQSKVQFAVLLDELELPQPPWRLIRSERDLAALSFPYWLKAAFSTAGRRVREISDERSRNAALAELLREGCGPVMAQRPARGRYGQVQGLFDRAGWSRCTRACGSAREWAGAPRPASASMTLLRTRASSGSARRWDGTGGLTLDCMSEHGERRYIECNPRTVEPANAAASGVNLPELQVRLTLGEELSSPPRVVRARVRTHGPVALLLGAAARRPSRRAVLAEFARALTRRGCYRGSREQLTPIIRDPPSFGPLAFVLARLIGSPARATELASHAIASYSVPPDSVATVTHARDP